MKLYQLPPKPVDPRLLNAHSILERSGDATEALLNAFQTVRKARKAKGTPTDHEQDLMRAALVFAAAGLDSLVKQLIRDTLQVVISKNEGAKAQFAEFVQSKLKRTDGFDIRFLAEALASDVPGDHLKLQLVNELTSSSLQSKDQLLRAAAYFAIPAVEVTTNIEKLKQVFHARNQIAHEMDILLGQPNRGRRQRKADSMKDFAAFVLSTSVSFYLAVEKRL